MFSGSMIPIVTPFKDGEIDKQGFLRLIEFHLTSGSDGIIPCGTTGESATLTHKEHEQLINISVEAVNHRVPVIAGTGSNSTDEAIKLTACAQKAGADGALLITPYYNKPTQEGLYQHYKAVAEAVDVPIILYNVPSRTSSNILPQTVARLSQIDNIAGIKEATADLNQISQVISLCPDDFSVLSGDDFTSMPTVLIGGTGVISVTSNVAPRDMADMMEAALAGDVAKANQMHYKLFPLFQSMFYDTNPVPAKKSLELMGKIKSGTPRLPLYTIGDDNLVRLKAALSAYGLI